MIELNSIEEQELSRLAGLAVNPTAQRLGYSDKKQYLTERDLSLALIKGKSDILWLAERYAQSYAAGSTPTVNQYRDYIFSLMLTEFIKDFQYYPGTDRLTNHAIKVWRVYDYKKVWPYIAKPEDIKDIYGWGPLGSVSFYAYYSPAKASYSEANWLQLVGDCLQLIWLGVGQKFSIEDYSSNLCPNERLSKFLDTVGVTEDFISLAEELFHGVFRDTSLIRRREGESLEDLNLIKQRILFGEFPQHLYEEALSFAPDRLKEDFSKVFKNLLSALKPAGVRLLLQAIVLESLYQIADTLTQLEDDWKDKPLIDFLQDGDLEVRTHIAQHWVTLSDAQYLQNLFSTPPLEHKDSSSMYLWLSSIYQFDTSLSVPYRLSAFI